MSNGLVGDSDETLIFWLWRGVEQKMKLCVMCGEVFVERGDQMLSRNLRTGSLVVYVL